MNKKYIVLNIVVVVLVALSLTLITVDVVNYNLEYYFIPSILVTTLILSILIIYLFVLTRRMFKYRRYKQEGLTHEQYKEDLKHKRMKFVIPKVVVGVILSLLLVMLLRDSIGVTSNLKAIQEGIGIEEYAVLECSNLIENGICGVVDVTTEDMYVVYFNEDGEYGYKKPGSMFKTFE